MSSKTKTTNRRIMSVFEFTHFKDPRSILEKMATEDPSTVLLVVSESSDRRITERYKMKKVVNDNNLNSYWDKKYQGWIIQL